MFNGILECDINIYAYICGNLSLQIMANPVYSLIPDEIEPAAKDFVSNLGEDYKFTHISETDTKKRIEISKGKDKGILFYYIKRGQISFSIAGKKNLYTVCENCQNYIIQETKLEFAERKSVTLNNVGGDNFLAFIETLEEAGYTIKNKDIKDPNIKYSYKIIGKYKDELNVNYYNNRTLLAQGRITPLFLDFTVQYTPLLSSNDTIEDLKTLLSITDTESEILNSDLRQHIMYNYDKIEGKIEMFLNTSLLLINTIIKLPDYSSYCFSALKALEGIIKKRFVDEIGSNFEKIGEFFEEKKKTKSFILKSEKEALFANESTCRCLENAYSFFNKTRHPLFHADNLVEGTRIIGYDESLEITKECLRLINSLCKNWN
ncbi:hypothetical protein PSM36_0415 [Proteiniphilum saccharofermentans]|uniref:Uncharacterized protein n=2 Tax=Proteiniphilum saccharofermentans TaxID=1642647 RepID=A0A1R3T3Z7_9BACT|nr:hypothetical protein PSM36_0415 [Proteiniphilum saccharofermentans]